MPSKKERREALERMTKAELVRTVTALDARQTKLLNEIASLTTQRDDFRQATVDAAGHDVRDHAARLAAINEMVHAGPPGAVRPREQGEALTEAQTPPRPDPHDETRVLPFAPLSETLADVHNALRENKPFPWEQK